MLTLSELQTAMREFICGESRGALAELVEPDGLDPTARLSIYRNNALITLESTLRAIYPVVWELTGASFFSFVAGEFIRSNLPQQPCLSEYGALFPDFLRSFPGCANHAYFEDVAKLEWLISRVLRVGRGRPISLRSVVELSGDPAALRLKIDPALRFLHSLYPIDVVWQQHQPGAVPEMIDINSGEVYLQIREAGSLFVSRLPKSDWVFRATIADGHSLGHATEAAFDVDSRFNLPEALAALFGEGLTVGLDYGSPDRIAST